jgi:hypothetical protein
MREYSEGCENKRLWSNEKCQLLSGVCVVDGSVQLRSGNSEFEKGLGARVPTYTRARTHTRTHTHSLTLTDEV